MYINILMQLATVSLVKKKKTHLALVKQFIILHNEL